MGKSTKLGAVALAFAVLASAAPSWAGMQFLAYEGRDAIQEGRGGEKKVVDGVDFWLSGSPPHRFQVLGSITDERHKTGLIGAVAMSGLEGDVAKRAKQVGGDAVILVDAHDNVIGSVGAAFGSFNASGTGYQNGNTYSGNASGYGHTTTFRRPIENHDSRYVVVRYLPDDPPAQVPSSPGN